LTLETRKYKNEEEIMTVVKLRDGETIIDEIKIYNKREEIELDKDLRFTAENIDEFLLKIYQIARTEHLEFDSQIVNL
jgi:hypothetical protein